MLKKPAIAVGAIVLVVIAFMYCGPEHQRFIEFDRQRDAWHRRCDLYIGKPVTSPAARACAQELQEMTAYAERQGW